MKWDCKYTLNFSFKDFSLLLFEPVFIIKQQIAFYSFDGLQMSSFGNVKNGVALYISTYSPRG